MTATAVTVRQRVKYFSGDFIFDNPPLIRALIKGGG